MHIGRRDVGGLGIAWILLLGGNLFGFAEGVTAVGSPSRIEVTLVLMDAVVTDRKGVPARGLGASDFDLLVDNVRSPIYSMERTCGGESTPASSAEDARKAASSDHYILLFDLSHMKIPARRNSIKAALRYVDEMMSPGDQVMALAVMKGLRIISNFTNDRVVLHDRLTSVIDDHDLIDTAPFEEENTIERFEQQRIHASFDTPGRARSLAVKTSVTEAECRGEGRMAEMGAARAVRVLANAMPAFASMHGRKALVLFSETLREDPAAAFSEACGLDVEQPSSAVTVLPEMRDLVRRANLAGVTFYSVHSGGMSARETPSLMRSAISFQTSLSLDTGGEAFVLMNNPLRVFERAKQDLSCYYTLGYKPPEGFRAGEHTVRLTTRAKGLSVRHRASFVIQSSSDVASDQMLAALSSPGLYHDLKVETHGYTLGDAGGRKRQLLLKASVPIEDLTPV